ncbi:SDR family NAD(P)-dependent oxidoreductase [Lentzea sp. BCCO 10_0061]|uniref:SDR family NAD(P)-dependent oxidoreductase n=1 Tax=Lentzea sokolovensis TaxID=3095429 RepID=A0ABU4UU06_9PSEU|nr:SDR family NAD(P)-dependent oxidoreductase [Lentzea sp. BCCO 10_0061]MDX8142175.1 SDR family NAD(P)-dependent oxidoreductase [Lentzea sp. BCCO 10_0061]
MDLAGKVAVVTGAGAGLGRAEALELARAGASIVLNDLPGSADAAAAEIEELGAKCVVVEGDVGERSTADALVTAAMEQFGGLHVLVNNAGVLRDRMLFNMSDEEWDLVVRVHLRGHFLLSRNAVSLWKQQSKAAGEPVYARIVNTSSEAFLLGSEGQANYAAAKAGIAALTVATARGTSRYGVRANAICPRARTQMTAHVFGDAPEGDDSLAPEHVAKFVAHLAGPSGDKINGQVFVVHGGMVALMAPPTVERKFGAFTDLDGYFADRDPQRTFACTDTMDL